MSTKIQKSLQGYLSKIKNPQSPIRLPSKKWILSGCKHPRTPSFSLDDKNEKKDDEVTLADVDRFLFENFKSLYFRDDEETSSSTDTPQKRGTKSGPIFLDDTPLDLRGSSRFYRTRGSFSGPLFDTRTGDDEAVSSSTSTPLNSPCGKDHKLPVPENCVVVLACSESPDEDFKRSMKGMVEARQRNNERVDWDFMGELLFCHISMNQKKSHKFILSAFVELITAMRHRPDNASLPEKAPGSFRTVRIGREVMKKTKEVTLEFQSSWGKKTGKEGREGSRYQRD